MDSAPFFSIIIPAYNVADYLGPCLESVREQTDGDFEALIIDDGSTDGSAAAAESFVEKDPVRFRLFRKSNGGLSDARNFGLERARGEYILFLDGDDRLENSACERLRACIEEQRPDLVMFDFWNLEDTTGKKTVSRPIGDSSRFLPKSEYLIAFHPSACIRVMPRRVYMENNIRFPVGLRYEDLAVTGSYLKHADRIYYLHEPLYVYVYRADSIINQSAVPPYAMDRVAALERLSAALPDGAYHDELEYLYIYHIVMAFLPTLFAAGDSRLAAPLCDYMWKKYPHWERNRYFREREKWRHWDWLLVGHKRFFLYKALVKARDICARVSAKRSKRP